MVTNLVLVSFLFATSGWAADSRLQIAERSASRILGTFTNEVPIKFDSRCALGSCTAIVTVGTHVLRIINNHKTNEFHIQSSHQTLTKLEQQAIRDLIPLVNNKPKITPAEELLFRYLDLLSDAPIDTPLEDRDLSPPPGGVTDMKPDQKGLVPLELGPDPPTDLDNEVATSHGCEDRDVTPINEFEQSPVLKNVQSSCCYNCITNTLTNLSCPSTGSVRG